MEIFVLIDMLKSHDSAVGRGDDEALGVVGETAVGAAEEVQDEAEEDDRGDDEEVKKEPFVYRVIDQQIDDSKPVPSR